MSECMKKQHRVYSTLVCEVWKLWVTPPRCRWCVGAPGWEGQGGCGSCGLEGIMHRICMEIKLFKGRCRRLIFVLFLFGFSYSRFMWERLSESNSLFHGTLSSLASLFLYGIWIGWFKSHCPLGFPFCHIRNHPNIVSFIFCVYMLCKNLFSWPLKDIFVCISKRKETPENHNYNAIITS